MQAFALYPPYFDIGTETSFDVAWEVFCCDMLNLHEGTTDVRRRKPPEQGVDLLWDTAGRAYQCKSTETGRAGDINITQTVKSLGAALATQTALKWTSFGLCTNADLTGTQEAEIKAIMPKVLLYTPAFWRAVCENHPAIASQRFRAFISLSKRQTTALIAKACVKDHVAALLDCVEKKETYGILVYSNRRREVFELPVAAEFTAGDVVMILVEALGLPAPHDFAEDSMSVSIRYELRVSDTAVPSGQTLAALGLGKGAVVTLWKRFICTDRARSRSRDDDLMEFLPASFTAAPTALGRQYAATRKFRRLFDDAWDRALVRKGARTNNSIEATRKGIDRIAAA
jgi:hypothetical protein